MKEHVKVSREQGIPADMSVFNGEAVCHIAADAASVGAAKVTVGYAWWAPTRVPVLHRHDVDEVLYVVSGQGFHLGQGNHLPIQGGDFVFAPAGYWHGVFNTHESELLQVIPIFGGASSPSEIGFELCPPEMQKEFLANLPETIHSV